MKRLILSLLILFTTIAEAEVSQDLLDSFQTFAARDLIMFGAPKGTTLGFTQSLQGYFVQSGQVILGNAVAYERCLAQLDGEDIQLTCHKGLSASLDICKLEPSVCQKETIKQKLRDVYIDPNVVSGETMRGLGTQTFNAHMHSLTELAKQHASARKAIAQAMTLNGCTSVELGDIEGQSSYLNQQPLADDETKETFEGAENRWRAIIKCRSARTSVYLDVVMSVEQGKIHLNLVPVKAVEAPGILIEVSAPNVGPKR